MQLMRICGLLRDLRDAGPMTVSEMADVHEVHYDTAYHWVRTLKAEGILRAEGRKGQAVLWALAQPLTPAAETPYLVRQSKRVRGRETS